jgi:hypothetical protein
MDIYKIARICYEVNRAYCQSIGDYSDLPWEESSENRKNSYFEGIRFNIRYPNAGPAGLHNSWISNKLHEGWKYGPVKDPEKKEHPCLLPYDQLPAEQKSKDFIFCALVRLLKHEEDI